MGSFRCLYLDVRHTADEVKGQALVERRSGTVETVAIDIRSDHHYILGIHTLALCAK